MKKLHLLFAMLFATVMLFSCGEDEVVEPEPGESILEIDSVLRLDGNQAIGDSTFADTVYYSLRENKVIDKLEQNTTNWDIGFYRTTIMVNGGTSGPGDGAAIVINNTDFTYVTEAPSTGYNTDSESGYAIPTGSGNGWYNYDHETYSITPKQGVILIIKTADGKYAKLQMLSYYKGYPGSIPDDPYMQEPRYYSFKYAIQMNGTKDLQ